MLSDDLPRHLNILQQAQKNPDSYINPFELEAKYGEKWRVQPKEEDKYRQLFCNKAGLNTQIPNYGYAPDRDVLHEVKLPAEVVKEMFIKSGLDMQNLRDLWRLSDMDKDEKLCYHEFIVAMHLLKYARDNKGHLPLTLPTEFITYVKRTFGPKQHPPSTLPPQTLPPSTPPAHAAPPPPGPPPPMPAHPPPRPTMPPPAVPGSNTW